LHAHQPTGNFDFVFRENFDKCYDPLLQVIETHPTIPVSLHFSGILLEWLAENEPTYMARLRALVDQGRVELIGSGFGEPILVMLNEADRRGQMTAMSDYLEEQFGERPKGMWLTERVWEQGLAHDIAESGLQFTLVDDTHFVMAGLRGDDLSASYITEDRGSTIRLFPSSEKLRYYIPFQKVSDTIAFLESNATDDESALFVYGDDAEKFGAWPGTFEHVFEKKWLARFFDALANSEVIEMMKISDALDVPPRGRLFLPDASYREMMEWALPYEARREFLKARDLCEQGNGDGADSAPFDPGVFLRGGTWRTFLAKYPESGAMQGKMLEVSRRIAQLPEGEARANATLELYRAQCNCAYWHGVFGGLYLPHLRFAVYQKLLAAERIVDTAARPPGAWVDTMVTDVDRDGYLEITLASDRLGLLIHPRRGGHIVAIDEKRRGIPLTAALSRRPEVYHEEVAALGREKTSLGREKTALEKEKASLGKEEASLEKETANSAASSAAPPSDDDGTVASIHDQVLVKEEGLHKLLVYDAYQREGAIDHFFDPATTREEWDGDQAGAERGDFVEGQYKSAVDPSPVSVSAKLHREGIVRTANGPVPVRIEKEFQLGAGNDTFNISYAIENRGDAVLETVFGCEFLLALLAGDAHDRRLLAGEEELGPLRSGHDVKGVTTVSARDEWLDVRAGLSFAKPTDVWITPIQTVSHSEAGFESVYQATAFMPRWKLALKPGDTWVREIKFFAFHARGEIA
ncbi:MAG: DUF1926 domain-containing protein, partial [Gemmatimonadetes bacterium]|nr:DUF1926 domain-containing protein [Gemmatimonadota bacterium]